MPLVHFIYVYIHVCVRMRIHAGIHAFLGIMCMHAHRNAPVYVHVQFNEMDLPGGLPAWISNAFPPLAFNMFAHAQLSIREHAIRAFSAFLSRSQFRVRAHIYIYIYVCVCVLLLLLLLLL